VIRSGAVVDRSILDKEVVVGQGAIVGEGPDFDTPNRQEPARLNTGISVVGKRAIIPRGVRIGRNVKVAGGVRASDFATRVVKSGASIEAGGERPRQKKGAAIVADDGSNGRMEPATRRHEATITVGAVSDASAMATPTVASTKR
jgi:hypothetical protein